MPAPSKYPGVPMTLSAPLWLPVVVRDAVRARAAAEGVTVSDLLRAWIIAASGVVLPVKEAK